MNKNKQSWQAELLAGIQEAGKVAILGVGSELKSDDAAGMRLIDLMQERKLPAGRVGLYPGSTAPENYTGVIRDFAPELLIIVDAAYLEAEPGTVSLLAGEDIGGLGFSTHMLPLSVMLKYLHEEGLRQVMLLGIQPASTEFGLELSPAVQQAVEELDALFSSALQE